MTSGKQRARKSNRKNPGRDDRLPRNVGRGKGQLAEVKVFWPEFLGRIDKVYVFRPLEDMVVAEIARLKISKLAREY